jgi:small subunit ribosomal protein S6
MLILPPEADESVVSGVLDRIAGAVSQGGGEVGNVDRWGRRRLAYEIDRRSEGYYVVVEFRADPAVIVPLERSLHLADEVVRFKVVVRGEVQPAPAAAAAG